MLHGRYELGEELGRGGWGIVYSARDVVCDRAVAIKIAYSDRADAHEELLESAALAHEHIVSVHERGQHGSRAYIVMEKIDGCDLARHAAAPALLPLPIVLSILARVADALVYAHAHGVVHGDVKPSNVLYSARSGTVKLADFAGALTTARLFATHRSVAYTSPEQICGTAVTAASDQFSFGVTLYQLATGALPFDTQSLPQLLHSIAHARHIDVRERAPRVPARVAAFLDRALAKNPQQRFRNSRELLREIRALLQDLVISAEAAA